MASHPGFDPRRFYARARTPSEALAEPFERFARVKAASGFILLGCAAAALALANSPWAGAVRDFWQLDFTVGLEGFELEKPLILWVNDGLMAVFFFLVGLEIKREMLAGELASLRQAMVPVVAAVAAMAAPALVYLAVNAGTPFERGWGIPMATDIAFVLCVLSLLGDRVPLSLKVFLTALAIVDDIGAVLVIAVFYTPDISRAALAVGLAGVVAAGLGNALRARATLFYALAGLVAWVGFLKSGVHPTVAGVLVAMCIPARTRSGVVDFKRAAGEALAGLEGAAQSGVTALADARRHVLLAAVEQASRHAATPLRRMEHALVPWVSFGIMPIFALANAGVSLEGLSLAALARPVTLGVAAGLALGKLTGVFASVWLMHKTGLAPLPAFTTWRHVLGAGILAGIGFTMSLFVAQLAFASPQTLDDAKVGIIAVSLFSGVAGWLVLRGAGEPRAADRPE